MDWQTHERARCNYIEERESMRTSRLQYRAACRTSLKKPVWEGEVCGGDAERAYPAAELGTSLLTPSGITPSLSLAGAKGITHPAAPAKVQNRRLVENLHWICC